MRPMNAATHLIATLAITAAAVVAAFVIPTSAHAMSISIFGDGDGSATVGSGKEVDVARPVGAFSVLRLEGPVDVIAHPGTAPLVKVHADDNIEPLIETIVEGDALVVRVRKGAHFRTSHKLVVDVDFTSLAAARQHGSGNLRITSLRGPAFESVITGSGDLRVDDAQLGRFAVSVSGSGDVALAGRADDARFSITGSGDVDARDFAARDVGVELSGSGDARVNATEKISARVAGSGDVTYRGHPHDVSRRVTGSGSIAVED